ncbi:MAG: dihydroorotate dehydrogenase electron transfer subunit [Candidatus Methanomethylophilaceae archaeon]|nr:dihydroorotate dehydrogenase electron transfer subunit [Candidatus Methanomethylophilaceae archaeon]MDI3541902.1 dihydroorotate dehydrogenase electron transfer subunit [Candidatus Methanomethylophilaceae archaeon]HIJ00489.1 dihydroorotate dehydrogenase electron transfer subunit [Candidatus Methanomethylophilaceae archaeon]
MTKVVVVKSCKQESRDTVTISFDWEVNAVPGQFIMVWVPGVDEVPMSLSSIGTEKSITVRRVGEASSALHALRSGDKIGVRGPYGNGFKINGMRTLVIGGGVGIAPLMPLLRTMYADVAICARTADELMFVEEASRYSDVVRVATDDGSKGFHGNAVQLAETMMASDFYEQVIACGPEIMLYHLWELCERTGITCQMSLERYMKCAVGLCGSCMLGRERVCVDGPVFTGETLRLLHEFGHSRLDEAGRSVTL